jgi:DNA-binding NarL/FixJ family response regulator
MEKTSKGASALIAKITPRQPTGQTAPATGSALKTVTAKQRELLELIIRGETDKACAAQLGVTYSAIRKRTEGLFRKLGAHNKAETVARFLQMPHTG